MQAHIQTDKDDVQIPLAQRRPKPPPLAGIKRQAAGKKKEDGNDIAGQGELGL